MISLLDLRLVIWNDYPIKIGLCYNTRGTEIFLNDNYIDIMLVSETYFTNKAYLQINE